MFIWHTSGMILYLICNHKYFNWKSKKKLPSQTLAIWNLKPPETQSNISNNDTEVAAAVAAVAVGPARAEAGRGPARPGEGSSGGRP